MLRRTSHSNPAVSPRIASCRFRHAHAQNEFEHGTLCHSLLSAAADPDRGSIRACLERRARPSPSGKRSDRQAARSAAAATNTGPFDRRKSGTESGTVPQGKRSDRQAARPAAAATNTGPFDRSPTRSAAANTTLFGCRGVWGRRKAPGLSAPKAGCLSKVLQGLRKRLSSGGEEVVPLPLWLCGRWIRGAHV